MPIGLAVAGANRNDMKLARETIENLVPERPAPTEAHPHGMCLDKGYDFQEVRDLLAEFGFTAHIRARGEEAKQLTGCLETGAALGRRAHSQLDESLSTHSHSMG